MCLLGSQQSQNQRSRDSHWEQSWHMTNTSRTRDCAKPFAKDPLSSHTYENLEPWYSHFIGWKRVSEKRRDLPRFTGAPTFSLRIRKSLSNSLDLTLQSGYASSKKRKELLFHLNMPTSKAWHIFSLRQEGRSQDHRASGYWSWAIISSPGLSSALGPPPLGVSHRSSHVLV